MKNIHILATDKPSRLLWSFEDRRYYSVKEEIFFKNQNELQNQNIYITSDEEINQQTKPCWCINTIKNTWDADLIYYQGSMPQYHYKGFKKIILTTDLELQKDGVQAIPDEFLEWFVENPSCEKVEVRNLLKSIFDPKTNEKYPIVQHNHFDLTKMICKYHYELIIPKEEPKKKHIVMLIGDKVNDEQTKCYCGHTTYCDCGPEEPKQETLEEVIERLFIHYPESSGYIKAALIGKEWQMERSYSEEDMYWAMNMAKGFTDSGKSDVDIRNHFEQFKKK